MKAPNNRTITLTDEKRKHLQTLLKTLAQEMSFDAVLEVFAGLKNA
ncbi:MAG: hypothetical protein MUF71_17805 [Candidatus Kapabacteria bacterium]|jgi:hypothetical protein|nr:hypothetical protein [Candidatus Kapabacteria bacterium]